MSGKRSHVSKERGPIVIEPREQMLSTAMKPRGFWYEVNADWRRWCRGEMPEWLDGRHLHRLVLGDERMLVIRSARELDRFYAEYGVTEHVNGRFGEFDMDRGIRWYAVADRYDGIEIAPYLWERRLDGPTWYYGWDCASGVIWNPRGATVEWSKRLSA